MASRPTPAVAAVLWRERGGELQLYLAQRAPAARFFCCFWSFPGGSVEPHDNGLVGACVRELREETGVELDPEATLFVEAGRWVTPAFSPIRFDARYYLIEAPAGADPDHLVSGGEHVDGAWTAPAAALERWTRGEWLIPGPIVRVLRVLLGGVRGAAERCALEAEREARAPRIWDTVPAIARSPLRTPTLPPATHTNCYVVGASDAVVIDPASPYADERAVLDEALDYWQARGRAVREILLTHHHLDHIGGAQYLAQRLGVPIAAHAATAELVAPHVRVDRFIEDGEVLELAGEPRRRLRAVFTPGHAPGHLCFLEETTGLMIVGDMLASDGTIIVDPDEGDMAQYLASLARIKAEAPRVLLPAHGGPMVDAAGKVDEYVEHRLWRERRVLEALTARGEASAGELVPPVYQDVDPRLFPLAERSLTAHLIKLANDGRIRRSGDRWML